MAQERYTRTNQKLYFAGLTLDSWRKAELQGGAPGVLQAERETALFHLYGALLGLCQEIAGYYRLPGNDSPRAEALLDPALLVEAPSPELAELVELAQQPGTWLAQLLGAYRALYVPLIAPKPAKAASGPSLIEAVSLESEVEPVSRAELEAWRQSLKGLAQRFREGMVEW
ncbi:MAG: DUF6586 family protein [Pseudomonas sp.]|uniref:DUF6586 family protein n=1 Tax=Pseudomonas sp. TaxID=306 RepID=UPI00339B68EF